ncbi:GTPase HflX [Selenomonadales bacterium OttesenSCG-928-I06]|nr:GTPase HflX [Selenomonadales bacterium OttesenSCG-928-I06]
MCETLSNISGDIKSIKKTILNRLENLYNFSVPRTKIINEELALELIDLTYDLNREIAIYLNRRGEVTNVSIGDHRTAELTETKGRKSTNRLSGIRCIHTHPNASSNLSNADLSSLKEMRFDLIMAIGVQENTQDENSSQLITDASFSYIHDYSNDQYELQVYGPLNLKRIYEIDFLELIEQAEKTLSKKVVSSNISIVERALLVGISSDKDYKDSLEELAKLTKTAGAIPVGAVIQSRSKPDVTFYIGKGKLQEVSLIAQEQDIDLIIFDEELSSSQKRNLTEALKRRIVDRTELILDIFAQRAHSYEGKLQVELAQLKYILPRLIGTGLVLSRQGAGIGTRGPGETKLEVDRRKIRNRISFLDSEIKDLEKRRQLQREQRIKNQTPIVSLVGYTNSGKSTLLNKLTNSNILAEDKLFATLEPNARKATLPSKKEVVFVDTVGFIKKLPHQLVASFKATLEEVSQADLLLHVIDLSNPIWQDQSDAVFVVLKELKSDNKPIITVFNKIDKLENPLILEKMSKVENSICISAKNDTNLDNLVLLVDEFFKQKDIDLTILIPHSQSHLISKLYEHANIKSTEYLAEGTLLDISLKRRFYDIYKDFIVGEK